ncbi:sigma-54-dependent transcriptional regulator [Cellulomonas dongxiuzhuiae]|uniref:Sigma 54-interacting transcriptional regulator n=1 Tax=Cellulomonas dongxiuzhuiae TaxID=2819979 RepID=A0ABX8GJJ0_9CELL|nr:sigma 54-interacting transcriptional regulator [Cellulomonas dongxiuzhuiae]MBO3095182.1 sigma-54-dependent Fis family transcriptional regulator [Cellulomonas dongxiuzhuiae]QWC16185.1 sigma 54-interacting transcriptional regulator [Cellulomonas dongxiuzhuiae]
MAWFRVAAPCDAATRARLTAAGLRDADAADADGRGVAPDEPGVVLLTDPHAAPDPARLAERPGRVLVALAPGVDVDPWSLLACGAADVVHLTGGDLRPVLDRLSRWQDVDELVRAEARRAGAIGTSSAWRLFLRDLVEVARWSTAPVLLLGETGAGKELAAHIVHRVDLRRRERELVLLDCTTVVPTLSGSEFFGHEKGAFTGAATAHEGAFARADGGTLFLDEVGELPAALQAALLRVVQEGTYQTVGGTRRRRTDFRLVAATHRDLRTEGFRADLYHRLAATTLRVPPLRERRDDVLPLFRHFLAEQRLGGDVAAARHRPSVEARGRAADAPEVSREVADALRGHDWPGNVRELRQLAARVAARHVGDGPVTPGDLPPEDRPVRAVTAPTVTAPTVTAPHPSSLTAGSPWESGLESAVRGALSAGVGLQELKARTADVATRVALDVGGGTVAAARLLGVSRRALGYRTAAQARPQPTDPSSDASS